MAKDLIRYDVLVQDALRGVVRKVLREVAETGLPGEHHFYIAFDTTAPGVRMSSRLRNQYPAEMTIVLQHQFWDLSVTDHTMEIGLSFHGVPERLLVPFAAVKGFFDPSVQFGLQFEPADAANAEQDQDLPGPSLASPPPALPGSPAADKLVGQDNDRAGAATADAGDTAEADADADAGGAETAHEEAADKGSSETEASEADGENGGAEVVSLDAFRKKT